MDLDLTDEQRSIREMVRDFAAKEIMPHAQEFDERGEIPRELLEAMAELGLLGCCVPEEYGGAGLDYLSYVVALEEVCKASASVGLAMKVNNTLYGDPILRYGTPEQKAEWLTPAAKGQELGCFCLTEPGSGSDAMALATSAVREGEGWVLTGTKLFVTNGQIARRAVVFATVDRRLEHRGVTAFLVETSAPGVSVARKERKMGLLATDTCELSFERVRVGPDRVLGGVGEGYRLALTTLDAGRIGIAAQALGIGQAALEAALRYASERSQFGRTISEFGPIQEMLADMGTELEAARLLTWRAALRKEQAGERGRFTREASMAKLFASEMAVRVASLAVQIHGGYGYMKDYAVERYFRDARALPLYEGTSQIQRIVIARELLKGMS